MGKHKNGKQHEIIIRFMEQHKDLARGFVKGGKVVFEQLWEELVEELNAYGPPIKEVPGWKKVWTDMRLSVKQRLAKSRMKNHKTGGRSFTKYILSPNDQQVAVICGLYASVDGVKNTKNYGVPKNPSTSKEAVLDLPTSSHDADEQQEAICEMQTNSHNAVHLSPAPACNSPPKSPFLFLPDDKKTLKSPMPTRNSKMYIADAGDVMEMEMEEFTKIAGSIEEVKAEIKENSGYLKEISKNLKEIRIVMEKELKFKEKLLEENKRHHMALERKLAIELKIKFLELERLKLAIEPKT